MRPQRLLLAIAITGCVASGVAAQDRPAPAAPGGPSGPDPVRVPIPHRQKGAFLGVATSAPTTVLREQLKLAPGMGLVVDVVEKDSPAEQAGIRQYDVLTKVGDQLLVNAEQLAVLVRTHKPGEEIDLTVVRGGAATVLKARLVERELTPLEDLLFFRGMPDDPHAAALQRNLLEAWRDPDPGAAAGAPPKQWLVPPVGGTDGPGVRSTTVWSDGAHSLTVTCNPGKGRRLVAKDESGDVLFDGDLDAPGARDNLPPVVAEKLKKMESAGVKPPKRDAKPPEGRVGTGANPDPAPRQGTPGPTDRDPHP